MQRLHLMKRCPDTNQANTVKQTYDPQHFHKGGVRVLHNTYPNSSSASIGQTTAEEAGTRWMGGRGGLVDTVRLQSRVIVGGDSTSQSAHPPCPNPNRKPTPKPKMRPVHCTPQDTHYSGTQIGKSDQATTTTNHMAPSNHSPRNNGQRNTRGVPPTYYAHNVQTG